jgi:hypothetical protein
MIFKPELAQAILDGRKTQTRRLVTGNTKWDSPQKDRVVHVSYPTHWTKWEVGKDYAVCPGRGKKAVGRIRITGIRRERLKQISHNDAVAEGCKPLQLANGELGTRYVSAVPPFMILWDSIHTKPGTRWADNPDVWVLDFEPAR